MVNSYPLCMKDTFSVVKKATSAAEREWLFEDQLRLNLNSLILTEKPNLPRNRNGKIIKNPKTSIGAI